MRADTMFLVSELRKYQKSGRGVLARGRGAGALTLAVISAALGAAVWAAPAAAQTVRQAVQPAQPQTPLEAVVAAREAVNKRQWAQLPPLVSSAKGDPLAMYAEYWLLRYRLNASSVPTPAADLEDFMRRNQGAYLADRLRGDWVLAAARSGDFATARRLGEVMAATDQVKCAQLEAAHLGGQRATPAQAQAVFTPGSACWDLYDQLVADRVLGPQQLIPALRDALEANKRDDARRYAAYVFEPAQLREYDALMKDPMKWLVRQPRPVKGDMERELVAVALSRLARSDMTPGEAYLRREWEGLPRELKQWVYSQFALVAVLNLDDRAHEWYKQAGDVRMSEYNHAWRVRAALRQPKIDWAWVMKSISQMPASQQAEPVWVYWHARGLQATGHSEQARKQYESIAPGFNFYGQLAAEELGRVITVPARPSPLTDAEIAEARGHAGLQRAVALFKLGWRPEAVPEWNYSLRGMNDRQLMAAAELARQEGIYDRVVNTSERTESEFDFTQRFIAPFEGRVSAQARQISLDPAWVYGLIRQESRFITDARSVVGASGLMQLMPATAKWVAKRIGMTDFQPSRVNEFEVNTILGTNYLNMVLGDLNGSQVLASAGYNAGPGRPRLWRSRLSHQVEGAIFAETIPFTETRLYVKNVLSNATYYAALFTGEPQSLKARLGHIAPQRNERTALP
ncbi:Soluble lytic murein transglycosylase precursor [plant metagenome]|uniref:Soluble lytic murein transglycosylase n=2 Tax=plant metagenome TaxID=1297885 RepID=A0A484PZ63_9ZZZZ